MVFKRFSQKYGLALKGQKLSRNADGLFKLEQGLYENTLIHFNSDHYVVLKEVKNNMVMFYEPSVGESGKLITVSMEEFQEKLSGKVLSKVDMQEAVDLTAKELKETKGAFFWFVAALFSAVATVATAVVTTAVALASAAIGAVVSGVVASVGAVVAGISAVASGITTVAGAVAKGIGAVATGIGQVASTAYTAIQGTVSAVMGPIGSAIKGIVGTVGNLATSAMQGAATVVSNVTAGISQAIGVTQGAISSGIGSVTGSISGALSSMGPIGQAVGAVVNTAGTVLTHSGECGWNGGLYWSGIYRKLAEQRFRVGGGTFRECGC